VRIALLAQATRRGKNPEEREGIKKRLTAFPYFLYTEGEEGERKGKRVSARTLPLSLIRRGRTLTSRRGRGEEPRSNVALYFIRKKGGEKKKGSAFCISISCGGSSQEGATY